MVRREDDGALVSRVAQVAPGDRLAIRVTDGELAAVATSGAGKSRGNAEDAKNRGGREEEKKRATTEDAEDAEGRREQDVRTVPVTLPLRSLRSAAGRRPARRDARVTQARGSSGALALQPVLFPAEAIASDHEEDSHDD